MESDKLIKELEKKKMMLSDEVVFLKGHLAMIGDEKKRKESRLHEVTGRIMQIRETVGILKNKPKQG